MSRHFLRQSQVEPETGDLVQASEKLSGAAVSLEAIVEQRNWRRGSYALRQAVVSQLGAELGPAMLSAQTFLYAGRVACRPQRENLFENFLYDADVRYAIGDTEAFMPVIGQLVQEPPRPFQVSRPLDMDARRISQRTGYEPEIGSPMPWDLPISLDRRNRRYHPRINA